MEGLYSTALVDPYGGYTDFRVPPTEFLVFPFGEFTTEHGTFVFDEDSQKTVMAAFARKGVDHSIDYEHQALQDPPVIAIAAGSRWVPQIRDGALWATEVKWTDKAWMHISAAEYRYISPAFTHEEKEPRRVKEVVNLALTNIPAMHGQDALVKATGRPSTTTHPHQEPAMEEELKKLRARVEELTAQLSAANAVNADLTAKLSAAAPAKEAAEEVETITSTLSLAGGDRSRAGRATAITQLAQLRATVRQITDSDNDAAAIGKLHAFKTAHADVARLSARLAELETEKVTEDFEMVLTEGTKGFPAKKEELRAALLKASPDGKVNRTVLTSARACIAALSGMSIQAGTVGQPPVTKGADEKIAAIDADIEKHAGPLGGYGYKRADAGAAAAK